LAIAYFDDAVRVCDGAVSFPEIVDPGIVAQESGRA
jgi:hypothetical protein